MKPTARRLPPKRLHSHAGSRLFIGFDPSLTHFACVVLNSFGDVVEQQTEDTGKLRGMPRIDALVHFVKGTILKYCDRFEVIPVREDYAFAVNSGADSVLKELGGVIDYELYKIGVTLHRVGIAQVKKFITGKGNAQKDQMMLAVYKHFSFDPSNEHEADAFGVAATAKAIFCGPNENMTKAQHEVVTNAIKAGHSLTNIAG